VREPGAVAGPVADARTEGMFLAQYKVLRENGHSPSEAFNETVEEATQSLFPLIGKYGSAAFRPPLPRPR
jgi:ketol-acid reductoisomerase